MNYNPNIHHRKSIRLKGYDYSQAGLYFITICCDDRKCLFGDVTDRKMILNDAGKMIETEWLALLERFTNIALHEFVVMPNHFHGILQIVGAPLVGAPINTTNNVGATLVVAQNDNGEQNDNAKTGNNKITTIDNKITTIDNKITTIDNKRATTRVAPTKTVGDMMDAFKSITTVEYIRGVKTLGWLRFDGKIWQRNYHEHIIRDEKSYNTISNYIINNPKNWKGDKFYNQ